MVEDICLAILLTQQKQKFDHELPLLYNFGELITGDKKASGTHQLHQSLLFFLGSNSSFLASLI